MWPHPHLTGGAGGLRLQRRDRPRASGGPAAGSGPPCAVTGLRSGARAPGIPGSRDRVATVGGPGPAPQQAHPTGPLLSRQTALLPASLGLGDLWPAGTSNHVRGQPSGDINSGLAGVRRPVGCALEPFATGLQQL